MKWYRNGVELVASSTVKVQTAITHELATVSGQLSLDGALLPSLSGTYTLVAENAYGSANSSCVISEFLCACHASCHNSLVDRP